MDSLDINRSQIDEESDKWPELSPHAMPGWIGEFVKLACDHSEADPVAVLITLLTRFAAALGANPYINIGDAKHYARINAVIVGASAKARKGTSARPVERLFGGISTEARFTPGPLSSGEGLIYAVRDEVSEYNKKTDEYEVVDPGTQDKRLFVLDEEFSATLKCTKREGNTLSSIIRGFFDSGSAEPLTKNSRIKATNAHVCVVTHIVQLELTQLLDQVQMSNGFCNRFLWILARRQRLIALPSPMPDYAVNKLAGIIAGRLEAGRQKQAVCMTSEAIQLWIEAYPDLTMDYEGVAGSVVNRAEAYAIRLALIYAIALGHTQIDVEDLQAAFAIVDYSRRSAFKIFGGAAGDKKKAKILSALKTAPNNELTLTDISVLVFSRHIESEVLKKIVSEMEDSKLIVTVKLPTGGAPKTVVKLPPLA